MLKYVYDHGTKIESTGSLGDTINAICVLIHEFYVSMRKNDPAMADLFRKFLIATILLPNSPLWDEKIGSAPNFELFATLPKKK